MTYSIDFRCKVLQVKKHEQLSYKQVSKRFGIAVNTVYLWTKNLEAKKTRDKPASKIDMQALKNNLSTHPDAYQYERASMLGVSRGCIMHALKRLKVSYKKKPATSQGRS
jgi:transposase